MVRYDKCVEALYDRALVDDRTKTLQILKVMRGAISMSKSRTGECIFRTNKSVRKEMDRLVKIEVRNANYNMARIDTNKKAVVGRWTRLLENQTTCSSQTLFEEVLGINSEDIQSTEKDEDHKLKNLIDIRLTKLRGEIDNGGLTQRLTSVRRGQGQATEGQTEDVDSHDPNNGELQFVTERSEIRNKYTDPADARSSEVNRSDGVVLAKASQVHLPTVPIRREVTYAPSKSESKEEYRPTFDRDLTDWNNWALKDKSWITGYIHREKTRHEDLIIRNALTKIENELSGANMIKRHQLRQKLQNDKSIREVELKKKERRRKERQSSRELLNLPPKPESPKQPEVKIHRKKHVEFSEPMVEILPLSGQSTRTVIKKPKSLAKCKTFAVSLPVIVEGAVPVVPRKSGTSTT